MVRSSEPRIEQRILAMSSKLQKASAMPGRYKGQRYKVSFRRDQGCCVGNFLYLFDTIFYAGLYPLLVSVQFKPPSSDSSTFRHVTKFAPLFIQVESVRPLSFFQFKG